MNLHFSLTDKRKRFHPPSHSLPPKPHRRSRKGRTSARTLSAHPVPLLFLSKGTQDMSPFGIFRAKVTRPWEPSKGTCPIGHCAVGTLPAAFLFFTGQGTAKRRYSGKLPPRSLVWLPEGDLLNARKKRKRDKPRFQITKRPKDRDLSLKEKFKII